MRKELWWFEWRYHCRQLSFQAAVVFFFGLGALMSFGRFGNVNKNAPYVLTTLTGLLSLTTVFAATVLTANVCLRDSVCRMESLIFSTSFRRVDYFWGRFAALWLAVFGLLAVSVAGVATGCILQAGDATGPFRLWWFVQPLLAMGAPNITVIVALLFPVALFTRSTRAVYVTGVLLYILYLTGSILGNSPLIAGSPLKDGPQEIWPLLSDPFGLSSFFGDTRLWTDSRKNTQLYGLSGAFAWNRLVWTGFSVLMLLAAYRWFPFRLSVSSPEKRKKAQPAPAASYRPAALRAQGPGYVWTSFMTRLGLEIRLLFRQIPFWVMILLWVFLYAVELQDAWYGGPYGMRLLPTTGLLAEEVRPFRMALPVLLFFSSELAWSERHVRFSDILAATPVTGGVLWASKLATLAFLIVLLIGVTALTGIGLQLAGGYTLVQPSIYVSLVYYSGLPLLYITVLLLFIQATVPNRYLGLFLGLVALALVLFSRRIGLEHYLLRYASVPELSWSDMNGWGHYGKVFHGYMVYWGAVAVVLSLWTAAGWGRRRVAFSRAAKGILTMALLAWAGTGWYLQQRLAPSYLSEQAERAQQIAYEQRYRPLAVADQPVIRSVRLYVDLFPAERRYRVRGTYRLKNEGMKPLDTVWVGIDRTVETASLALSEKHLDKVADRQHFLSLREPLAPGAEMTLHFSLETDRSGFVPFDAEHAVVPNGSYVELEKFLPWLGYNPRLETRDRAARKAAGLTEEPVHLPGDTAYHPITLEMTFSTDPGQVVVANGTLVGSGEVQGRPMFRYRHTGAFRCAFSSARYAVREERHNGVRIRIYHHPGHEANIPLLLRAATDALAYGSASFRPYPLPELQVAEIPHYPGAATAYPGAVFSAENINFLGDFRKKTAFPHAYSILTHEISHQWWPHQMAPVSGPGDGLLTESLAKYTEAVVTERFTGREQLATYLKRDNNFYFGMREDDEQPLDQSVDQIYVEYQKGGLVLYGLRERLGETRVNGALKRLMARHCFPGSRVRPADLIRELSTGASESETRLIRELLSRKTTYTLSMKVLKQERLRGGVYRLLLEVAARKGEQGRVLPVDEDVEIGVFKESRQIYSRKHRIQAGNTRISLNVREMPEEVAVDPMGYLLDPDQRAHTAKVIW